VGEVEFQVNDNFSTDGFANWNWDEGSIDSWRVGARYSSDFRRGLGVSYSWEETTSNLELDLIWPLAPRWQLGGAALIGQSDDNDDGSYTRVSLGYDACCWALQAALEDRPRQNDDDDGDDEGIQFMLTLQLKGLGTISTGDFSSGFTVGAAGIN